VTLRHTDYALLAQDAYTTTRSGARVKLDGVKYAVIDKVDASSSGFQGVAYRRLDTFEVVIAYRGTEFDREAIRDGLVDTGMVIAGVNVQAADAEKFTQRVIDRAAHDALVARKQLNVSVTGHSLGGTLAEMNAYRFNLRGETFNAYGAAGLEGIPQGGRDVINHVRAGDPVSAASRHFGEVRVYATKDDVDRLSDAGYGKDRGLQIFRTVQGIDVTSHYIDNFTPRSAVGKGSILTPDHEQTYRDNRALVDQYRSEVFEIRKHASVIWETRDMVIDGVLAAGHVAADHAKHGAQLVGTGARHAASGTVDVMRAAGLVAEPAATTLWGSKYGSSELEKMVNPPQLNDAAHPDHLLFEQARQAVYQLDTKHGRTPDTLSENLAASLTVAARREGMSRIDHVALSEDAQWAYAVQGELNSPFKKVAEISTEIGISTSIKENTSALHALAAQQQSNPEVPSQALSMQQQNHTPAGPAMSR
jgi:hypothetical protein